MEGVITVTVHANNVNKSNASTLGRQYSFRKKFVAKLQSAPKPVFRLDGVFVPAGPGMGI